MSEKHEGTDGQMTNRGRWEAWIIGVLCAMLSGTAGMTLTAYHFEAEYAVSLAKAVQHLDGLDNRVVTLEDKGSRALETFTAAEMQRDATLESKIASVQQENNERIRNITSLLEKLINCTQTIVDQNREWLAIERNKNGYKP